MEVLLEHPTRVDMKPGPILDGIADSKSEWNIDLSSFKLWNYNEFTKERIAEGFFGVVSKITHTKSNEVMVLKELKKSPINDEKNRKMFQYEITLISKLKHPNLLKFEGITIHNGNLCLLSEFIDGGSLEMNLSDKCPSLSSWDVCLDIALDIARGMTYLHGQGIIHRDLSSRNILLKRRSPAFQAIIADLGLCCTLPELPLNSSIAKNHMQDTVGSPFHMAPEVLTSKPYDQKADVFSFGIILCEVMSGCPGGDPDDVPRTGDFGLAVEEFSNRVVHCPVEFLNISVQCCQLDPMKRPSFLDLVKALDIILDIWHELKEKRNQSRMESPDSGNDCIIIEESTTCSCVGVECAEATITPDLEIKELHDRHGLLHRTGSRRQLRLLTDRCPRCGGRRLSIASTSRDGSPLLPSSRAAVVNGLSVPSISKNAGKNSSAKLHENEDLLATFVAPSLLKQNADEMNESTSTLAQNTPGKLPRFFQYIIKTRRNKHRLKQQAKGIRKRVSSSTLITNNGLDSLSNCHGNQENVLLGSHGNSVVLRRSVNRALSEPPDVDFGLLTMENRRHSMPLRAERSPRSEIVQRKSSDNSPVHKSNERKQRSRSFFNVLAKMRANRK